MQYVLKNISGFIRHYTGIFLLIVVCQIVCILLSFFSFGVYQNFRNESNMVLAGELTSHDYYASLSPRIEELPEKYKVSPDHYDGLYKELGKLLGDKTDCIIVDARSPKSGWFDDFAFLLSYSNGEIIFYEDYKNNMMASGGWDYGRSFTKSEYINGERVCIAPTYACEELDDMDLRLGPDDEIMVAPYPAYKHDDKWYVNIEGTEYECIGFSDAIDIYYLPYNNIPESITITSLPYVDLVAQLTVDEYEAAIEIYKKYFPDIEFEMAPLDLIDTEVIYYYNTNMWISVLIAVISSVNLALIMNYILTRRRKSLAIFRITGCSARQARHIYVAEIMLILNVLFAVCLTVWVLWILPALGSIFKYMQGAFSPKIYLYIYLLYMIISYVIMNIMTARYIRRSPVELLKAR